MTHTHDPSHGIPDHGRRPAVAHGRRPRMVPFLATGAVLGAFLGLLLTIFGPEVEDVSIARQTIILSTVGALLCGLLAAIVYLVVERVRTR